MHRLDPKTSIHFVTKLPTLVSVKVNVLTNSFSFLQNLF